MALNRTIGVASHEEFKDNQVEHERVGPCSVMTCQEKVYLDDVNVFIK